MRYGKTHAERYEENRLKSVTPVVGEWRREFAWLPVTIDGREVWWESYLIRDRWVCVHDLASSLWPGFWTKDKKVID